MERYEGKRVFCDYDFSMVFGKGRLPAKAGTEPCGSSATAGQGRLPAKAGTEPCGSSATAG
ncbi:MAG: hypothetical protein FWE24_11160, partial [Defluviitaleaceae bacterium]|nr:hypothetical protein [Defluviitaleaceae bacterium]